MCFATVDIDNNIPKNIHVLPVQIDQSDCNIKCYLELWVNPMGAWTRCHTQSASVLIETRSACDLLGCANERGSS